MSLPDWGANHPAALGGFTPRSPCLDGGVAIDFDSSTLKVEVESSKVDILYVKENAEQLKC